MIDDVEAFRAAWAASSAIQAEERPNAKIQVALDRLAEGVVSRVAHGSTVEAALKPYIAAIKKGEGSTSDSASLDAKIFRDGDRWLVDVRMGYASSVSAFGRKGRLTLPAPVRWSYRQFGGFFRTGSLLAFDGMSLSDAGVRYSYRLAFLRRTAQGYVDAGAATGFGTYDSDEARLVAKGSRVIVKGLDAPRAFFVSNAENLLRREETWDTSGPVARRNRVRLLDPDVRAVDDWLWAQRGKGRVPRELGMVSDLRRGKGWVEMSIEGPRDELQFRFDLALVGKKNVVRRVTIK